MTRVSADWLALREPADAAARAPQLIERVRQHLTARAHRATTVIHDLGCGTGSMARALAVRIPGPQHWVMYDRDADLLEHAAAEMVDAAADGAPVTVEIRQRDITDLSAAELEGAGLITASALLDMLTREEVERVVASCVGAACPTLLTLSVLGRVELTPPDPLDSVVAEAFNAHQRRTVDGRTLLGPDAVDVTVAAFRRRGADVVVHSSPWRLGATEAALTAEWLGGWVGAAREQRPELSERLAPYAARRREQAAAGRLGVVVHHSDILTGIEVCPRTDKEADAEGITTN